MIDDLISRQSAVDAINKRARDAFTFSSSYQYYFGALHDVADDIKQLPSAQQEQWTLCSDKLPEEKSDWKSVTVLDESGDTAFTYTSVGFYLSDGWWIVDNEPMEDGNLIRVVAWMPLPEPWRGQEHVPDE